MTIKGVPPLVFAACCALPAHATEPPPAVAPAATVAPVPFNTCRDKYKCDHFVASAGIGVLAGAAITANRRWQWAEQQGCGLTCQRWAACLAPGIAKEVHDEVRWGTASWKDMAANAVGCALGLWVSREF